MKETKKKVLLFIKIPPPVTGATIMNKYVRQIQALTDLFSIRVIPISYKSNVEDNKILSFVKIGRILTIYLKLLKELVFTRPSIIYFQLSPYGLAFLRDLTYVIVIRMFNVRILYHIHGKGIQKYIGNSKIKLKIYKWIFKKSSVICLADSLVGDLKNVFHGKLYVVNNGIQFIEYEKSHKHEDSPVNILFFSNLLFSKGVLDYLDAIVHLEENGIKNFRAFIGGKEAEITEKFLQHEIEMRGVENTVTYLGSKFDEEKFEVFKDSDLFVFPTYHLNEAFPLVLIEAMQAELPIIASSEGAIPEIIDNGITGYLVDSHNPQQIADKLKILINDSALRKKMGKAAKMKYLSKYTLDIFESNLKSVFEDVLENMELNLKNRT
jgi:glycosyltransferase involved in cell wall biosynthesis